MSENQFLGYFEDRKFSLNVNINIDIISSLQKSGAKPENHGNVPQSEVREVHSFESEVHV